MLIERSVSASFYILTGANLLVRNPLQRPILDGGASQMRNVSMAQHPALVIESIFLFEARKLIGELKLRASNLGRKVKFDLATSVPMQFWAEAELYPARRNHTLVLTTEQEGLLALFREEDGGYDDGHGANRPFDHTPAPLAGRDGL
jgi:hypothetical protein